MKIVGSLIIFACIVISVCVIYLVKQGVSLHSAPYIAASPVSADFYNVPQGVFTRLFPDFQQSRYILWGLPAGNSQAQQFLQHIQSLYENEFKHPVRIFANPEQATELDLKNCLQACWLIFPEAGAHGLSAESWSQKNAALFENSFVSLSWVDFTPGAEPSEKCLQEKLLDFECLKTLSIKEVGRKMKDPKQRYFFMRKYQDHDYFLFVEKSF